MRVFPWAVGVLIVLLSFVRAAGAAWPENGAPVAIGPGPRNIRSVVADGADALFVAWDSGGRQVRVQRLRADGEVTPGWGPDGVALASPAVDPGSDLASGPSVVPDGAGGCFVAWGEVRYPSNYVRVTHLLASGVVDPAWPAAGTVVASAFNPLFFGSGSTFVIAGLAPTSGGGCVALITAVSGGCHDGFCSSGGSAQLVGVSATGVRLTPVTLEPHCATQAPEAIAIEDGGGGLFALIARYCPSQQTLFQHAVTGSEPPVPLPIFARPRQSHLARAADGSVLACVGNTLASSVPTWFHWNADGSPVAGSPASGVPLPSAASWRFAPDASGSSVLVWVPASASGTLLGLRLAPDGSVSPGWPATGALVAGAPAVAQFFAASSDGAGGVVAVWNDARNGTSSPDIDVYAARLLADGVPAPGVPAGGYPLTTAPGFQGNPFVATLAPGLSIAVWHDLRSGTGTELYAQRLLSDAPVPAQASLARAEARADRVSLEWRFSESVPEVTLQRTRDGHAWAELVRLVPGSRGSVAYEDTDVRPGQSLGYRLEFRSGGDVVRTSPAWVEVPNVELAVRVVSPSAGDRLAIEVALASNEPARLELLDVTGRQRRSLALNGRSTGTHQVELPVGDIAPSIAWLRLIQGRVVRTLMVVLTR